MQKIMIIVDKGEAKVRPDTVPSGIEIEIVDLDIIRMGDEPFPSQSAYEYCLAHGLFTERRERRATLRLAS